MKQLANMKRVRDAEAFIIIELRKLLDRWDVDSYLSRRIREVCPAYNNGLSNSERVLATLRALNVISLELSADLAAMTIEDDPAVLWEDDDEATLSALAQAGEQAIEKAVARFKPPSTGDKVVPFSNENDGA